ncbi:hypothetical protein HMPREF0379_0510 [[Eubacterium] yurii subsp. margaretiae ATCC 43715]|nr:hypothetical protein HMPREF0379_0510 [[Eubacterium] yurii subsp. margaretiae ATCC 43715]
MKKREFLDLLRFYLKDMPKTVTEDIISDYEEHFSIATEKGKSEEEICRELGSPEAIAKEYISGEKIHLVPVDIDENMRDNNSANTGDDSNYKSNYERSRAKKSSSKDEDNKKTLNILLIVLVIIGIFSILPPIFGFGFGLIGLVIGIVTLILSIIFAIFWGVISLILGIFKFGIGLIMSVLGAIFSFLPFSFHHGWGSNIFMDVNPFTGIFAGFTTIVFGLVMILIGILVVKFLFKTVKDIFITIKWKKRRSSDEKGPTNSDNTDVDR